MVPARELYLVVGEDRALSGVGRAARWSLGVVQGLFGDTDAPAMSDVVIRSTDGLELRRIQPSTLLDFEDRMREALADLETLDSVTFAAKWLQDPVED